MAILICSISANCDSRHTASGIVTIEVPHGVSPLAAARIIEGDDEYEEFSPVQIANVRAAVKVAEINEDRRAPSFAPHSIQQGHGVVIDYGHRCRTVRAWAAR